MSLLEIIEQLESIRENSASFLDAEEPDSIWQKDIEALDEVLAILKKMNQKSWWSKFLLRLRHTAKTIKQNLTRLPIS